jgi:hypothetical protein
MLQDELKVKITTLHGAIANAEAARHAALVKYADGIIYDISETSKDILQMKKLFTPGMEAIFKAAEELKPKGVLKFLFKQSKEEQAQLDRLVVNAKSRLVLQIENLSSDFYDEIPGLADFNKTLDDTRADLKSLSEQLAAEQAKTRIPTGTTTPFPLSRNSTSVGHSSSASGHASSSSSHVTSRTTSVSSSSVAFNPMQPYYQPNNDLLIDILAIDAIENATRSAPIQETIIYENTPGSNQGSSSYS